MDEEVKKLLYICGYKEEITQRHFFSTRWKYCGEFDCPACTDTVKVYISSRHIYHMVYTRKNYKSPTTITLTKESLLRLFQ